MDLRDIVEVYSLKEDGEKQLSKNFKVREFRCKDGSDPVFVAPLLVHILQTIRGIAGASVNINSAYRTPSHNKAVGGVDNSRHMRGKAADIVVTGMTPREVAELAEKIMPDWGGIGVYSTFTHIDLRPIKTRWNG